MTNYLNSGIVESNLAEKINRVKRIIAKHKHSIADANATSIVALSLGNESVHISWGYIILQKLKFVDFLERNKKNGIEVKSLYYDESFLFDVSNVAVSFEFQNIIEVLKDNLIEHINSIMREYKLYVDIPKECMFENSINIQKCLTYFEKQQRCNICHISSESTFAKKLLVALCGMNLVKASYDTKIRISNKDCILIYDLMYALLNTQETDDINEGNDKYDKIRALLNAAERVQFVNTQV